MTKSCIDAFGASPKSSPGFLIRCERALVHAGGWVESDGQRGGSAQRIDWFPRGRTTATGVGHPPGDDRQRFGQLKAGEVGAEAVVRATSERLDRGRAHPAGVE